MHTTKQGTDAARYAKPNAKTPNHISGLHQGQERHPYYLDSGSVNPKQVSGRHTRKAERSRTPRALPTQMLDAPTQNESQKMEDGISPQA